MTINEQHRQARTLALNLASNPFNTHSRDIVAVAQAYLDLLELCQSRATIEAALAELPDA